MVVKMKLCVFCKNFRMDMGSESYSEITLGHPGSIECFKYHWSISTGDSEEDFRECIKTAESCKDYELAKGCKDD